MELLKSAAEHKRRADRVAHGGRKAGHLTFAERKRRAQCAHHRPEWLRTTNKVLDGAGNAVSTWDNADDYFTKARGPTQTDAERRASYFGTPAVSSRSNRRRKKVVAPKVSAMDDTSANSESLSAAQAPGAGARVPCIKDITAKWTLPDPLPDLLEPWRAIARSHAAGKALQSAERAGRAVLAAEVRKSVGNIGIPLLDDPMYHQQMKDGTSRDIEAIVEAVWATHADVRSQCIERGTAISTALLSLDQMTKEESALTDGATQLDAEFTVLKRRLEQSAVLARTPNAEAEPQLALLSSRLGAHAYGIYFEKLQSALRALRVLVVRQPGAVDGFEQMLRHVAVMNKDTAALGGVPINSINDVFDDLENNAHALTGPEVEASTRTIIGQSSQADDTTTALNADARQVLILHYCTRVDGDVDWRHLLGDACRCAPAVRQLAVDEAYGILRRLVGEAYDRVVEMISDMPLVQSHAHPLRNGGVATSASKGRGEDNDKSNMGAAATAAASLTSADSVQEQLRRQLRIMYRRHLLHSSAGGISSANLDVVDSVGIGGALAQELAITNADEDAAAGCGAKASTNEARFGHLLDAWMDALPLGLRAFTPDTVASTDSAGHDAFDFGAAVPRRSWNLYYAALSDNFDDDGEFLSVMRRAWGLELDGTFSTLSNVKADKSQQKQISKAQIAKTNPSGRPPFDTSMRSRQAPKSVHVTSSAEVGAGASHVAATVQLAQRMSQMWERTRRLQHTRLQLLRDKKICSTELNERIKELKGLNELYLGASGLRVPPKALSHLKQLRILSLERNALRQVPEEIVSLPELTCLALDHNRIEHFIEPHSANRLSCLRRLSLRGNRLAAPHSAFGEGLTQLGHRLTDLDLGRNRLPSLPVGLTALTKLRILNLEHNHLYGLPGAVLGKLTSIQELRLNDNDLTVLPDEIGTLRRLHTLTLHENAIARLPRTIDRLGMLMTLTLHRNCLDMRTTLEGSDWPRMAGLAKIENLTLHSNELQSLPRSLRAFGGLTKIDLHGNLFFETPPAWELTQLHSCVELDLSHNKIRAPVDLDELFKSAGFGKFFGRMCALYTVRGGAHAFLFSELSSFDMDELGVPPRMRKSFQIMQRDGREKCEAWKCIADVEKLEVLQLNHNKLSWIPPGLSTMKATLRVLHLQDNVLTALPVDIADCRNLRQLNLSRNKLTALPLSFLKLAMLSELSLAGNPWAAPLDEIVATSSYLAPQELDMDRAVRKIVKTMSGQLKDLAMNPSATAERFSPMPMRAALELFFRRMDRGRTGYINQRDFRDCMNGRRFDFRGITLTPAEVEAMVETLFVPQEPGGAGAGPTAATSLQAPPFASLHESVDDSGIFRVNNTADSGSTKLLLEEFIVAVEQSQRHRATAPLAHVVRKYLKVKQRQLNLRAMESNTRALDMDAGRDGNLAHPPRSETRPQYTIPGFEFGHAKRFDFDVDADANATSEKKQESQVQLNKSKQSRVKNKPKAELKKHTKARLNKQAKKNAKKKNKPDQSICMQAAVPVDDSNTYAQLEDTVKVAERDSQALLPGAARDQQTPAMIPVSAALLQEQLKQAQGAIAQISAQLHQHLLAGADNNDTASMGTGAGHDGTNCNDDKDRADAVSGVDTFANVSSQPTVEASSPEAPESSKNPEAVRLTPQIPGEAAPYYVRVVPITATGRNDAEAFPVLFFKADTVANLKRRIEEEEGVPVELQVLWAKGLVDASEHIIAGLAHEFEGGHGDAPIVLSDNLSLYKCGIKNGTELLLEVK